MEWDVQRLTRLTLQRYARAIETAGGRQNIWGFIDEKMCTICKPIKFQELYYSDYKKCHAIKFQAITTPDDLLSHIVGPWEGRYGDALLYREPKLQDSRLREVSQVDPLENHHDDPNNRLYLYGDLAYGLSYGVISAYKARPGRPLNPILQEVNAQMSALRVSVEHSIGYIDHKPG
jgi:hypothetical protein